MPTATRKGRESEEFLAMPTSDELYELIDGYIVAKIAPQRFHSKTQRALLRYLEDWGEYRGEVGIEWSVILQRRGNNWVPIPDLLFVSQNRLPENLGDEPCPVLPDLAIEIISPGQSFGDMAEKAMDYLNAGVLRVWAVDPQAQSITVFAPDSMPIAYRGDERLITDTALPELKLTAPRTLYQSRVDIRKNWAMIGISDCRRDRAVGQYFLGSFIDAVVAFAPALISHS